MLPNLKGYFRPKSIAEALALLEKNSGTILVIAGGTKLVTSKNETVKELVDITALPLNYITRERGIIRIGATTPLQQIAKNPNIQGTSFDILSTAAHLSHHSKMIRNVSTLGGELVTTGPLAVLYCALLVLQAQVRIAGGDEFALAINIFKNTKGLAGGLLTEVVIPDIEPQTYTAMASIENLNAVPIICVCARVTIIKRVCHAAKIGITGTEPVPQRLSQIEALLEGKPITPTTIETAAESTYELIEPISDSFAGAEYRKEISRVLVRKALLGCMEQSEENL